MRAFLFALTWTSATLLSLQALHAQVVPTTPTKFTKRNVGNMTDSGGSANIGLSPNTTQPKPTVREISYIALSDARQWTSTDGKALIGKKKGDSVEVRTPGGVKAYAVLKIAFLG